MSPPACGPKLPLRHRNTGRDKPVPYASMRYRLLVGAVCVVALAACMNHFQGQRPDDYRTMSCDELMGHLAAFDEKVKQAMAEAAKHAQGAQRQHAVAASFAESPTPLSGR